MSNHIYPWDDWFKKRRFTISRSTEFKCTTRGMIQQIRDVAVKYGLRVSIKVVEDTINVTVSKGEK